MKTNELKCADLRIGNWVKVNDPIFGVNTYKVATIRDNGIITLNDNISCLVDNIEPIELTEEVLLEIGFNEKNDCYILSNEHMYFLYYRDSFKQELIAIVRRKMKYHSYKNELKNYDIKYLHQLQNAYFILTGEELILNYGKL